MNEFIVVSVLFLVLVIVFLVSGVLGCMFDSEEFYIGGWIVACFATAVMIVAFLIEKGLLKW